MKKILSLFIVFTFLYPIIVLAEDPPAWATQTIPSPGITAPAVTPPVLPTSISIPWSNQSKENTTPTPTSPKNLGIDMSKGCMTGAGCSLDVLKTIGIKQDTPQKERTSVLLFVQDVILAATFFIGTVVTIAFIYSGFKLIYASVNAGERDKAIKGMKNAAIGMILVALSYAIIRLVQYVAAS